MLYLLTGTIAGVSKVSQQIQQHVAVCVSLILSWPFSFHLPKAGLDYFEMLLSDYYSGIVKQDELINMEN